MEVCPTEIVHAPAERIWQLFMDPRELAQWTGTKLVKVVKGTGIGPLPAPLNRTGTGALSAAPLRTGDLLVLRAGVMQISFEVLDAEPPQSLRLYVRLPFGVVNHEQVQITRVSSSTCRVTFN